MSKPFTVILPTGKRHELSAYLFAYYSDVGLLKHDKKPRTARLIKWINAWPLPGGALHFKVVIPETDDPYALDAVARLWRRILAMAPYSDDPNRELAYDTIVTNRAEA